MLNISGGHPKILEKCFTLYIKNSNLKISDLVDNLVQSDLLWRLITPFIQNTQYWQKLCQLLIQDDVGPSQIYLYDPLLRRLYWNNLLKRDKENRRLKWRCKALRLASQQILKCYRKK
ncbi:MAG: hypothetical protein GTO45_23180 [Candidatus Aminicenantes bacterium]|nr:hypothetical protein [Candidatus Aminicenantes bacterium]NIM85164.1 hypothetical protein [Candidatus Aminicenantes bacterium]NIN24676.1 hypothetical protein [Candidatus Aminicenantes bacterium]NIN48437.1 hypothetical protein [Candidatus Aminicenantes bacterium]NIN87667.1 hypothetical protein [Candidatus Aminicenantes bacterium]